VTRGPSLNRHACCFIAPLLVKIHAYNTCQLNNSLSSDRPVGLTARSRATTTIKPDDSHAATSGEPPLTLLFRGSDKSGSRCAAPRNPPATRRAPLPCSPAPLATRRVLAQPTRASPPRASPPPSRRENGFTRRLFHSKFLVGEAFSKSHWRVALGTTRAVQCPSPSAPVPSL